MGTSESLEIKRYLLDDNKINYYVFHALFYHGEKTKVLSILSCSDYMNYLKMAFEKSDNEIYTSILR